MSMQVVHKPALRQPFRGLLWGTVAMALGGGFGIGALLGGWTEENVLKAALIGIAASLAAFGAVGQLRARIADRVVPVVIALASWAGGFLIGFGARAGADLRYSAQTNAWFGTLEAKAGLVLLAVAIAVALWGSVRGRRNPA